MKGKILRVKHGYNPNSSSMGSIVFALPVSLIAISFGTAALSGLIFLHFTRGPKKQPPSLNPKKEEVKKTD